MEDKSSGYSRDEIFEQLKKIALEEERLYGGKQMTFDFNPKEDLIPTDSSDVGNSQGSIEGQPEVDFGILIDGSEDPVLTGKLWNGAQGLILSNIPKGKQRQFVLDEKKLFLKASANTRDSKFTFLHAVQTVFDIVENWVRSNEDPVELGMALWELNERNGFHSKKVASSFNATLSAFMKVPPPNKDK